MCVCVGGGGGMFCLTDFAVLKTKKLAFHTSVGVVSPPDSTVDRHDLLLNFLHEHFCLIEMSPVW